jgi:hypothetical protein
MFCMRLQKVSVARPGNAGLVFEFSVENQAKRQAIIQSYAFELWTLKTLNPSEALFLGSLLPDLGVGAIADLTSFGPTDKKVLNLVWHFSWAQIQQVEDWRNDSGPIFEIRNHVGVHSIWEGRDGTPQSASFSWDSIFHTPDAQQRTYPARIPIDVATWAKLLDEIGFLHIVFQELPFPTFPPGFARPQDHLKEAWTHHRAGREDESLQCCYRAFECLGFNLYGDDQLKRAELLRRLLVAQDAAKAKAIEAIWTSLQTFFHLGRHERGQAVKLSRSDGELAVVYATVLLKYLADSNP